MSIYYHPPPIQVTVTTGKDGKEVKNEQVLYHPRPILVDPNAAYVYSPPPPAYAQSSHHPAGAVLTVAHSSHSAHQPHLLHLPHPHASVSGPQGPVPHHHGFPGYSGGYTVNYGQCHHHHHHHHHHRHTESQHQCEHHGRVEEVIDDEVELDETERIQAEKTRRKAKKERQKDWLESEKERIRKEVRQEMEEEEQLKARIRREVEAEMGLKSNTGDNLHHEPRASYRNSVKKILHCRLENIIADKSPPRTPTLRPLTVTFAEKAATDDTPKPADWVKGAVGVAKALRRVSSSSSSSCSSDSSSSSSTGSRRSAGTVELGPDTLRTSQRPASIPIPPLPPAANAISSQIRMHQIQSPRAETVSDTDDELIKAGPFGRHLTGDKETPTPKTPKKKTIVPHAVEIGGATPNAFVPFGDDTSTQAGTKPTREDAEAVDSFTMPHAGVAEPFKFGYTNTQESSKATLPDGKESIFAAPHTKPVVPFRFNSADAQSSTNPIAETEKNPFSIKSSSSKSNLADFTAYSLKTSSAAVGNASGIPPEADGNATLVSATAPIPVEMATTASPAAGASNFHLTGRAEDDALIITIHKTVEKADSRSGGSNFGDRTEAAVAAQIEAWADATADAMSESRSGNVAASHFQQANIAADLGPGPDVQKDERDAENFLQASIDADLGVGATENFQQAIVTGLEPTLEGRKDEKNMDSWGAGATETFQQDSIQVAADLGAYAVDHFQEAAIAADLGLKHEGQEDGANVNSWGAGTTERFQLDNIAADLGADVAENLHHAATDADHRPGATNEFQQASIAADLGAGITDKTSVAGHDTASQKEDGDAEVNTPGTNFEDKPWENKSNQRAASNAGDSWGNRSNQGASNAEDDPWDNKSNQGAASNSGSYRRTASNPKTDNWENKSNKALSSKAPSSKAPSSKAPSSKAPSSKAPSSKAPSNTGEDAWGSSSNKAASNVGDDAWGNDNSRGVASNAGDDAGGNHSHQGVASNAGDGARSTRSNHQSDAGDDAWVNRSNQGAASNAGDDTWNNKSNQEAASNAGSNRGAASHAGDDAWENTNNQGASGSARDCKAVSTAGDDARGNRSNNAPSNAGDDDAWGSSRRNTGAGDEPWGSDSNRAPSNAGDAPWGPGDDAGEVTHSNNEPAAEWGTDDPPLRQAAGADGGW